MSGHMEMPWPPLAGVTPKPTPPENYGPRKRTLWYKGFSAGLLGALRHSGPSPVANPDRPWVESWQFTAWNAGFEAYHAWLQANRVRACDRSEVPA